MLTQALDNLLATSGFTAMTWPNMIMITVSLVLIYLAIVKKFEPLLLLPIAFGMLLANLPVVALGAKFADRMPLKYARWAAAALFAGLGAWVLAAPLLTSG